MPTGDPTPHPIDDLTAAEHIAWAKGRALEYVDAGDLTNAISSLISDLQKHPATLHHKVAARAMDGYVLALSGADAVRQWVERF